MPTAQPFITFQPPTTVGAAEAMAFWTSLFADGVVHLDQRRGPDGPGAEGTVELAEFEVAGLRIRCSDSPPVHAWGFSPAVSLFVTFEDADELARVFAALAEGGTQHMPLDDYGFGTFGWAEDRFGISWQLTGPAA